MGPVDARVAVGTPADRQLADLARVRLRRRAASHCCTSSASGSTAIRWSASGANVSHRLLARDRDPDRDGARRQVPELRRVDPEVLAREVDVPAVEERVDDRQRLLEHLVADVDRRPAAADDVLVEVLPRAEAEREPAVAEQVDGRGLLRDDRRVVAHESGRSRRSSARPARSPGVTAPSTLQAYGEWPIASSHGK